MSAYRSLILLSTMASSLAFMPRDQGYFDLSIGGEIIQDVKFNDLKKKYSPGPYVNTSIGLSYKNGLGVSLSYSFSYNEPSEKTALERDDSKELTNSTILLNFVYNPTPHSPVSFYVHGAPGLFLNSDQKMKSAEETSKSGQEDTSTTTTTRDAAGAVIGTVETTSAVSKSDVNQEGGQQFEIIDNFSFGYRVGGGIEFKQDIHQAYGIQINYVNGNLMRSSFDSQKDIQFVDEMDRYNGLSTALVFRYYM